MEMVGLQEAVERSKDVVLKRVPPRTAEFFKPNPPEIDPADVVLLVQELRTCLKCGGELRLSNDDVREWVCLACGYVWGSEVEEAKIPFEESSVEGGHAESGHQPITHLAHGGGLGSKVDTFLAADVLGDCGDLPEEVRLRLEEKMLVEELLSGKRPMVKNGKFRSPFALSRGSHVQVPLTNALLKELLTLGGDFCKKHGFYKSRNTHHVWFSDQVGINLIHVGRFYAGGGCGKNPFDNWRLAASVFCLLFRQVFLERYNSIRFGNNGEAGKYPELCLPDELLEYYGKVLKSCNPPVLPRL